VLGAFLVKAEGPLQKRVGRGQGAQGATLSTQCHRERPTLKVAVPAAWWGILALADPARMLLSVLFC